MDLIKRYEKQLDGRYRTMSAAAHLFIERKGRSIVETGCVRQADDWGGGMSTVMFGQLAQSHGAVLVTVDNSPDHLAICKSLTRPYSDSIIYLLKDSVEYLESRSPESIDLLYLDSFDYPYGVLLDYYGGQTDITKAMSVLHEIPDEEIIEKHGDVIRPSQEHCAHEIKAALHALHGQSIVLIDDANFPGGGKPRLARPILQENGWECIVDHQQCLWIKE